MNGKIPTRTAVRLMKKHQKRLKKRTEDYSPNDLTNTVIGCLYIASEGTDLKAWIGRQGHRKNLVSVGKLKGRDGIRALRELINLALSVAQSTYKDFLLSGPVYENLSRGYSVPSEQILLENDIKTSGFRGSIADYFSDQEKDEVCI